jgi:hypothetical protein
MDFIKVQTKMIILLGVFIVHFLVGYFQSLFKSTVRANGLKNIWDFYSSKENTDTPFTFLCRLGLVCNYLVSYFVFHTILGDSLYLVSITYLVLFYNTPYWLFFYGLVFGFVCGSLVCGLTISLLVKIEYLRNLLCETIGKQAFTDIMGDGPK